MRSDQHAIDRRNLPQTNAHKAGAVAGARLGRMGKLPIKDTDPMVASAQAAVDGLALHPWPHCIVSDYRLAGAHNGVQAVLLLRQQLGQDVAACVISGDADATVKQQTQQAGLLLLQNIVRQQKLYGCR